LLVELFSSNTGWQQMNEANRDMGGTAIRYLDKQKPVVAWTQGKATET
jgi:hypothetical protein